MSFRLNILLSRSLVIATMIILIRQFLQHNLKKVSTSNSQKSIPLKRVNKRLMIERKRLALAELVEFSKSSDTQLLPKCKIDLKPRFRLPLQSVNKSVKHILAWKFCKKVKNKMIKNKLLKRSKRLWKKRLLTKVVVQELHLIKRAGPLKKAKFLSLII